MIYEQRGMKSEVEFKASERSGSNVLGHVEGYANVFNTRSQVLFERGELFIEEFTPRCFLQVHQGEPWHQMLV